MAWFISERNDIITVYRIHGSTLINEALLRLSYLTNLSQVFIPVAAVDVSELGAAAAAAVRQLLSAAPGSSASMTVNPSPDGARTCL